MTPKLSSYIGGILAVTIAVATPVPCHALRQPEPAQTKGGLEELSNALTSGKPDDLLTVLGINSPVGLEETAYEGDNWGDLVEAIRQKQGTHAVASMAVDDSELKDSGPQALFWDPQIDESPVILIAGYWNNSEGKFRFRLLFSDQPFRSDVPIDPKAKTSGRPLIHAKLEIKPYAQTAGGLEERIETILLVGSDQDKIELVRTIAEDVFPSADIQTFPLPLPANIRFRSIDVAILVEWDGDAKETLADAYNSGRIPHLIAPDHWDEELEEYELREALQGFRDSGGLEETYLAVDDAPRELERLVEALRRLRPDAVILSSQDEGEALGILRERGPEISGVISDYNLSQGTGVGFLRAARAAGFKGPFSIQSDAVLDPDTAEMLERSKNKLKLTAYAPKNDWEGDSGFNAAGVAVLLDAMDVARAGGLEEGVRVMRVDNELVALLPKDSVDREAVEEKQRAFFLYAHPEIASGIIQMGLFPLDTLNTVVSLDTDPAIANQRLDEAVADEQDGKTVLVGLDSNVYSRQTNQLNVAKVKGLKLLLNPDTMGQMKDSRRQLLAFMKRSNQLAGFLIDLTAGFVRTVTLDDGKQYYALEIAA